MQVEDRLPAPRADVHDDLVVVQTGNSCSLGDELEHPLRLVRWELVHVAEGVHVALGDHEEVGVGLRVDVPDRREAVRSVDVVAFPCELAEEAIVRQRESPPP
jgi:hypothetical protein